jgi:hypothetical protein
LVSAGDTGCNGQPNWQNLLAISVVVEIAVLLSLLLMPVEDKYDIILTISPTLVTVYTCGTMLLGLLLKQRLERQQLAQQLHHYKSLLEAEKTCYKALLMAFPISFFINRPQGFI